MNKTHRKDSHSTDGTPWYEWGFLGLMILALPFIFVGILFVVLWEEFRGRPLA